MSVYADPVLPAREESSAVPSDWEKRSRWLTAAINRAAKRAEHWESKAATEYALAAPMSDSSPSKKLFLHAAATFERAARTYESSVSCYLELRRICDQAQERTEARRQRARSR